jgi:hypothetical protein
MTGIRVSTIIAAPLGEVWRHVSDISSHTGWMQDAEAIRFTSAQTRGMGVTFDCDTRVGPFSLTDRMVVTEWEESRVIGIHHRGAVSGSGRFTLEEIESGRTRFTWEEALRFPWWLGGAVGRLAATPVLYHIWRGNLDRLRSLIESERPTG